MCFAIASSNFDSQDERADFSVKVKTRPKPYTASVIVSVKFLCLVAKIWYLEVTDYKWTDQEFKYVGF